jgi:putative molybdopterin biosynthesis protein
MRKEFRSLLSLDEAKHIVLRHSPVPEKRTVPLDSAFGRVLAEKVVSPVDVPGFSRASMDGYAICSVDSFDAREDRPVTLELAGVVPMGAAPKVDVSPGMAVEVSTGSMMPHGADAVVMIEYTEAEGGSVLIRRPVHPGENIQGEGSDIMIGETLLFPGTVLGAREMGVLAAIGRVQICVRTLSVGITSTGNELSAPGHPLRMGQIYDINSYSVAAAVEECGAQPIRYGILADDKASMIGTLRRIAKECSMILVSGSTSAGIGDMVYEVMDDIGETIFHGVNLKPGKPTIFGLIEDTPCLGLPGYPASALTVFNLIAAPVIRRALGQREREHEVSGRMAVPVRSEGRRQMLAVGISNDIVYPMDKGSGSITTLAKADGAIEIPSEVEYLERGEKVTVRLFGEPNMPDLTIAGENCPVLENLIEMLPYRIRFISNGSRRGLTSAQDGIADLSSISHLEDESLCQKGGLIPVRGYSRILGLMAKDPSFFEREKIAEARIIGWSRDSEMNRLLKISLVEMGLDPEDLKITGGAKAHSAVAAAVDLGKADVGFGAVVAAKARGLLFKATAGDRLDLMVVESAMEKDAVKALLSHLKSDEFMGNLPAGISMDKSAGEIM